jgi:epoxyqueuosine reductase
MEKALAQRAGIGWQGKHTNLITKEFGSWVFLAEIITTAALDYDEPMQDFCGSCTACLDACPTGAIPEPYVVDSQRCISYLTIEHRGEIAESLGEKFDRWIYGCDICQDVCPWNRFQQPTDAPEFQPRDENIAPDVKSLTTISQTEFSQRFKNSPIKRTKREGIIRNAKIVFTNSISNKNSQNNKITKS